MNLLTAYKKAKKSMMAPLVIAGGTFMAVHAFPAQAAKISGEEGVSQPFYENPLVKGLAGFVVAFIIGGIGYQLDKRSKRQWEARHSKSSNGVGPARPHGAVGSQSTAPSRKPADCAELN